MKKKLIIFLLSLSAICVLSGCSSFTTFTSDPPGATVTLNGEYLGETPFSCYVSSKFGFYNAYVFQAEKKGYTFDRHYYQENSILGGASTAVPAAINFKLNPGDNTTPETGKDPMLNQ